MLPEGFKWGRVLQHDDGERAVFLHGGEVARLSHKVTGSWFAILRPYAAPFSPYVTRDCASFESGKAGIEAWVRRHEAHLRAQAAIDPRAARNGN